MLNGIKYSTIVARKASQLDLLPDRTLTTLPLRGFSALTLMICDSITVFYSSGHNMYRCPKTSVIDSRLK
jgi:hypothetical protein